MVNYEVDPAVLARFVPAGTELDDFGGRVFVSMVGFLFLKTRVFGVPFPWHVRFRGGEPALLRAAARGRARTAGGAERCSSGKSCRGSSSQPWRGCSTTSRISPGRCGTASSRRRIRTEPNTSGVTRAAGTRWPSRAQAANRSRSRRVRRKNSSPNITGATTASATAARWNTPSSIPAGASGEAHGHRLDCDVAALYGPEFVPFLARAGSSAFLVEGSPVSVRRGRRLP